MSTVTAARRMIDYRFSFPEADSWTDLAEALDAVTTDDLGLDFDGAASLLMAYPQLASFTDAEVARHILEVAINADLPFQRSCRGGIDRAVRSLNANCEQLLRVAGLHPSELSLESGVWWQRFVSGGFSLLDEQRSMRGVSAEWEVFCSEVSALEIAGCPYVPEWMGLKDTGLGYDILTYRQKGDDWVTHAVEVKSTLSRGPSFFLSRREWNAAVQWGTRYELICCVGGTGAQESFSTAELSRSIPSDQGGGVWSEVHLTLKHD